MRNEIDAIRDVRVALMQAVGTIILREMCSDTWSPESANETTQESRSEVNETPDSYDTE
jgi:hypothetical protein